MLKTQRKKGTFHRYRLVILMMVLSTYLSGCGFALKRPRPLAFHEIQLTMSGCTPVENALLAYLVSHKLKVHNDEQSGRPVLAVQCPTLEKIPLVYDGEGQLRRQRLVYKFNAEFIDQNTHVFSLKTTREQQLNSNQSLGDLAETHMIIKEMQHTLFHQLMNQLARIDHADNLSRP